MNEEHYQTLGSPPLKPTEADFKLRTASGALMPGMGFLTCNIQIGSEYYNQQFIVCKQLTPGLILGRDFLARNQLGITWGPKGVLQLRDDQNVQIQAMEETTACSAKLTANVTIPSRSLAAVTVKMILPSCQNKTRFNFAPITAETLLGPNCVIYPSPIVIVPKKTAPGEPPRRRMCVDYRMLNQLLPKVDKVHSKAKGVLTLIPLPKIDEIYAKLEGSTIYSMFDMRSGYYHLELSQESQPKPAFVVGGPKGGKWEFKRCPFGLTQAPAYFQMLVNKVLEGLEFAFGYLDDILIYSRNMDEHLQHVQTLFEWMRQADLKLTKRKCNFLKAHVQYLGHYISGQGLEPIPEKLESLQQMPAPTDLTEVRKFLGFVGYYQKFIPKYSDIARPLTNLTRKDIPFEWSPACQVAFEMLKEYLLKEPILKYPKTDQPYILYTDASKYAWAGVLTQAYNYKEEEKEFAIHHPITYVSGLFKGPQLNWAALTKEAYAIYMVARKLDYYLRDAETTIRSDHLPLKSFLLKNTKNDKVNNWGVELASKYTLKFEYVKGIKNTLADTMSRLVTLDPDNVSQGTRGISIW